MTEPQETLHIIAKEAWATDSYRAIFKAVTAAYDLGVRDTTERDAQIAEGFVKPPLVISKRPTIAELEKILEEPQSEQVITIEEDGSVTTIPTIAERIAAAIRAAAAQETP